MIKKLTMILMVMVLTLSAAMAADKPEGQRVVLQTGSEFSALSVNVPATVELVHDPEHAGYVVYHTTAPESSISAENRGGTLTISSRKGVNDLKITSRIIVAYGNMAPGVIKASATHDVIARKLEVSNCVLVLNGTGDIKISELTAPGGVAIKLNGTGDVKIGRMKAPSVVASLNGTGDIVVPAASASMVLTNNGTGNILVTGRAPQSVKLNGCGNVKFLKR